MTTLGQLKTDIALEITRPDLVANGAVASAVNAALRFYRRERFYFNVVEEQDIAAVVGQSDYALPDAVKIDGAYWVRDDGTAELRRVQPGEMTMALGNATGNGVPCSYAYVNRVLRIYPKPNATDTIRITGLFYLATPASDVEADNPWMTEAYDLIRYRAKAALYADYMEEQGGENVRMFSAAEAEQLNALMGETNLRSGTGFLEPTEF